MLPDCSVEWPDATYSPLSHSLRRYERQAFELGLVPSPLFSLRVVRSLEAMACCSDCFSIHNSDCSDYSDYYPTLALDSSSDSCCSHTDPTVVTD